MRLSPLAHRTSASIRRLRTALARPRGVCFLTGVLGGLYLLSWCQPFFVRFGTSLPTITGFALSLALAPELGLRRLRHDRSAAAFPGLMHFLVAAWTVALPWIANAALAATAAIPAQALQTQPAQVAYALATAALLIGVPLFLLSRLCAALVGYLSQRQPNASQQASSLLTAVLAGLFFGLLADVFFLAPLAGVQTGGLAAALIGGVLFFRALLQENSSEVSESLAEPHVQPAGRETLPARGWTVLSVACIGALLAVTFRVLAQFFAVSSYLLYAGWCAVGLGWALACWRTQRRLAAGSDPAGIRSGACLLACAWTVVVLAGFDLLLDAVLTTNAYVSSVTLQLLLRTAAVSLILAPFGWAWGTIAACAQPSAAAAHRWRFCGARLVPLVCGYLLCRWFGIATLGIAPLASVLVYGLLLLTAVQWAFYRPQPSAWWRRAVAGAATLIACAAPLAGTRYDPAASAELLFSTNVFVARQQGFDRDMLRVLDEGSPRAHAEGEHGTLTLWRHRGAQYQLRENGVPRAVITTAPHICPEYSPEILQAALPLVLHEQPRRVLLLGLGSGVPLSTTLAFPVLNVTCAEGDSQLVGLLRQHVWQQTSADPLADERVKLLPLDPATAAACRPGDYDVVVSLAEMAALHRSAPFYSREFYRNAARQLAADGIFCQRFQCFDFGPAPLQTVCRTMQSAFRDVILLESAAGEFLLLGTNSPRGLVREGLFDRLQAPHVRRSLASLGWDWSVPLNVSAFNGEALETVTRRESLARWLLHKIGLAESPKVPASVNTAAAANLSFTLPQEVMRWAPKMQEMYTLLAPHSGRLAEWGPLKDGDSDLAQRIGEVTRQRTVMAESADQYWAYRQMVRDQIKEGGRTKIIPVKGRSPRQEIHPVDRRRIAYFEALGKALNEKPARAATIDGVAEFASPYDPLISYFLHKEVAELHARAGDRDARAELGHRLHAIYFAHSADRSVRDIAAALEILAEHPAAVDSPQDRFDHLNALLQILRVRWELRGANPPAAPRVLMNDADACLAATQQALDAMERLWTESPSLNDDWPARRRYLERTIERPLRTYRTRLLPHHEKDLRKTREALEEASVGEHG